MSIPRKNTRDNEESLDEKKKNVMLMVRAIFDIDIEFIGSDMNSEILNSRNSENVEFEFESIRNNT